MEYDKEILTTAKKLGVFRPRDISAPRIALRHLTERGLLERTGRGLYRVPNSEVSEHHSLVEVAVRLPDAVISLLSALQFHGIGTQNPHEVWITLNVRARKPLSKYPPLRVMRASGDALKVGIEYHKLEGRDVPIYSIEKTIADCFKYRNKVGLDVALEALKDAWASKKINIDTLWKYSKICRVTNIIRPYIEAIQ